ncbi:hypothetical protein K501DRAFT_307940 [Backusella circina FSU 941]|nr:hypothetical protein K501DRAFT_307940 [Backusella circina FSU 941]
MHARLSTVEGDHCHPLLISHCSYCKLIKYFPNLERVVYSKHSVTLQDYSTYIFESIKPVSGIQCVYDSNGCDLICKLSTANLCSYLTELHLNMMVRLGCRNSVKDVYSLLPFLRNMPKLKNLTLEDCSYSAKDLEDIHTNITTLESLTIRFSYLAPQSQKLVNIKPAETMIFLAIEVFPKDIIHYPDLLFLFEDDLIEKVNKHGYLPLIKQLGPKLKKISLDKVQYNNYSIIHKMDATGCQIQKLVLSANYDTKCLSILSQSNQSKYIQDLSLTEMLWPSSYTFLETMITLVTLRLSYATSVIKSKNEVNLNMLFRACPKTLKSLQIFNTYVCFENGKEEQTFAIERLDIAFCHIPKGFDEFTSKCLPNCKISIV